MQQQRTDVLAAGPFAVFIERAGTAGADETAVLAQPRLGPVEVPRKLGKKLCSRAYF